MNALGRRLRALLVIAAKVCGGVKDLKCVGAEVLKHKKNDADGEVLEALLVGGAAGLKLECHSASTRSFARRSSSKRDLSETTAQRIKRILLVLKCAYYPSCCTTTLLVSCCDACRIHVLVCDT